MKTLKATMLVLLLGLFSFGVYHVGQLGTLTPWSTAPAIGDLSATLSLPVQLCKLQEQLYHLHWSAKDVAERALQEGLKQAKLPGVTGRRHSGVLSSLQHAVQEIINQALEKLEEIQVPMPDYALKSAGAAVIHSRTSPSLRDAKAKVFLYSLPLMDYMRSPELILEPENHPGNCWPFPGSQGHVFIKLSVPVIPRAVTMDHVSGTASHGESISGAPKDFAVYGFKEEHEEQGTFLGQFTFLAALNPSQTFQLKNELPGVMNYIRLQVLSNWGHPDYTCLYRFRVHGAPPKDGGDMPVSSVNKFH
ncbi:SUN domain-containing protein 3-like [Columba livia]|uniref:SUN domain-containing protein 3-like n=1 Tax=Columba livia TaxID=8932 RepID=A0A2I0LHT8_COLLI|nr:SUN domain-containing protein 3-like [Columba livia]